MRRSFVVAALLLLAVAAQAEEPTVADLQPLRIANAPPTGIVVDVPQSVAAQAAKGPIIIPAGIEFSTLGGVAFPGATGGVSVSYLVAQTDGGWAQFFVDGGSVFVEATPLAFFLGGSTSLTSAAQTGIAIRAGLGWFIPIAAGGKSGLFAYIRFPLNKTSTTTF